jgi:hypothetical protein
MRYTLRFCYGTVGSATSSSIENSIDVQSNHVSSLRQRTEHKVVCDDTAKPTPGLVNEQELGGECRCQ